MQIRVSTNNDIDFILAVHQEAFGEPEGETVSQLTIDLLKDKTALPVLSFVAEHDNQIVGNVIFSSVTIEGATREISAYIMAPLAVSKKSQGKGIGTKLIKRGLNELKKCGAEVILVLGDPNYYSRTGFKAAHNLKPPYELEYPEAWMAQELREGILCKTQGIVKCAVSLSSPKHW